MMEVVRMLIEAEGKEKDNSQKEKEGGGGRRRSSTRRRGDRGGFVGKFAAKRALARHAAPPHTPQR